MPKGVEHALCRSRLAIGWLVIRSLMPKGVEHENLALVVYWAKFW